MSLLAPAFLWIAMLAAVGVVIAHLFSRSRPREALLPTARFVPGGAARAPSRARTPTDLLLLIVRIAMITLIGLAFSRPVFEGVRRDVARVFVVDDSRDMELAGEERNRLLDAARGDYQSGDIVLAFDTGVRRAPSLDSLRGGRPTAAPGSLSPALIAAMREASMLARRADSVEIVVLSPVTVAEVDSATLAIRATWPGRIRIARATAPPRPEARAAIEIRAAASDPVRAAIGLTGGSSDAEVRVVRDVITAADSSWVQAGPRVLVVWPEGRAQGSQVARVNGDSIGGVVAGGQVVVAPFVRASEPPEGRVMARWIDGAPAASESALGAGCVRSVGIALPVTGDLVLRPEFGSFLREMLGPCGGRRVADPAASSVVATLAGAGPLAAAGAVRGSDGAAQRAAAWLLAAALALGVVEQLLRRSRTPRVQ